MNRPADMEYAGTICLNCGLPQMDHFWVKLAEWIDHPGMPDATIICPKGTWKQAPPENK